MSKCLLEIMVRHMLEKRNFNISRSGQYLYVFLRVYPLEHSKAQFYVDLFLQSLVLLIRNI